MHNSYLFLCTLSDPPRVSIQLGKSLVASDIREGVDVYFDCLVSANPTPKSKLVTWLHNVSNRSNIILESLIIAKQIICVKAFIFYFGCFMFVIIFQKAVLHILIHLYCFVFTTNILCSHNKSFNAENFLC